MTSPLRRLGKALLLSAILAFAFFAPAPARAQDAQTPRVYVIELTGEFGYDISQTPIRAAMRDARDNNANIVIVKIDAKWQLDELTPLPDNVQAFDELFRAEKILPIFADEMAREWPKPPRLVMWVKRAMGGSAFIPFIAHEIYFTNDGKMGGIGGIGTMLEGHGDEVVRQKQYSLRMARAEGFLIRGGYDPKIIRAMTRAGYILSYRMEGGQPVFLEHAPERPDEFALTSGTKDSIEASVRGMTREVLTLNADNARAIGVSKGTVDTLDDLIFQLGVSRNATMVEGNSKRIIEGWKRDIANASKEIKKKLQQFSEGTQGSGGNSYEARTQARGKETRLIDDILGYLKKYEEAFGPRWRQENRIPQDIQVQLELKREQIQLQQLVDKKK